MHRPDLRLSQSTVTEYVPAAAKIIGTGSRERADDKAPAEDLPGPPNRPQHDQRIEEFIQDQHKSKRQDIGPTQ